MTPEEGRFLSDGIVWGYGKAFSTLRCFIDLVQKEGVAVLRARPGSAWGAFDAEPKTIRCWPLPKGLTAPHAAQVQLEGNCCGKRVVIGIGVRLVQEQDARLVPFGYAYEPKKPWIDIPPTLARSSQVKNGRGEPWDSYIYIEPGDDSNLARDFALLLDEIVAALPNLLTERA